MVCWGPRMKAYAPSPELHAVLEQVSREMAVPVEGLVNQALFSWASLHGYAAPSAVPQAEPQRAPPAPAEDVPDESEWLVVSGGTFAPEPALDATAPRLAQPKRLVLIVGEREVPVDCERFLIGRDVSCNLTIDASRVSRQHAVITAGPQGAELRDLDSSNGTWLEGERIGRRVLQHGDLLRFGDSPVRVLLR